MSSAITSSDPWHVESAVVTDIRLESPGVVTYSITLRDRQVADQFSLKPGQFNMLYIPGIGEAAISVSGDPHDCDPLIHTVRSVGNVTRQLSRLAVGDTLGVRGPFGSHWPTETCQGKDLILVAGGIGLAPIRPVVYEVLANREQFGNVALLIGARSPADLLYADQYQAWQQAGIDVQTTVDRADADWLGNIGVVTLLIQRMAVPRPGDTVLMTCGPEVMMTYAIRSAIERRLRKTNLWVSLERNMNCAIGHCGHCQLGPHFICKDGPVLRFDRVEGLMEIEAL